MSGSRWRYYSYYCTFCEEKFEDMKDWKEDDITYAFCPKDQHKGHRIPDFTIPKQEIEERTHGGMVRNGKLYQRHTGLKEAKEQAKLNKQSYILKKKGDKQGAIEAKAELIIKQHESKPL